MVIVSSGMIYTKWIHPEAFDQAGIIAQLKNQLRPCGDLPQASINKGAQQEIVIIGFSSRPYDRSKR